MIEWLKTAPAVLKLAHYAVDLWGKVRDRIRPALIVQAKRGDWHRVERKLLQVTLEIFNRTLKPNSIRDYRVRTRDKRGVEAAFVPEEWTVTSSDAGKKPQKVNVRGVTIPPTGCQEIQVGTFIDDAANYSRSMRVEIEVTDLLGKKYKTSVQLNNKYG